MSLEPLAGTAVEGRDRLRPGLEKAVTQEIGEEMVMAVPAPLLIQRDQMEEVDTQWSVVYGISSGQIPVSMGRDQETVYTFASDGR